MNVVERLFIMLISTINLSMEYCFFIFFIFFFFFFFLGGGGGSAAAHQLRPLLKSLQKRAVKLVVKNSSTNVFKAARVFPLQSLTDFQRSLLIMKSTNDKVPQYIKALFTLCPNGSNRFRLPLPRLDIYTNPIVYLLVPLCLKTLCLFILGVPRVQYR